MAKVLVPTEEIARAILVLRGHRVLLDSDLATLYGVASKVLLQAVKRNMQRFPQDFMMQLTAAEWAALRSQFVTSKPGRGGRRYSPYAFTEQGVAMLSSVLGSERAIAVNIEIMRAFVRMRELFSPPFASSCTRWCPSVGLSDLPLISMRSRRPPGCFGIPVSLLPQAAATLAISLEDLIGKCGAALMKRGPAPKLQQQIERIQKLSKSRQRFVMEMLDTVRQQADP